MKTVPSMIFNHFRLFLMYTTGTQQKEKAEEAIKIFIKRVMNEPKMDQLFLSEPLDRYIKPFFEGGVLFQCEGYDKFVRVMETYNDEGVIVFEVDVLLNGKPALSLEYFNTEEPGWMMDILLAIHTRSITSAEMYSGLDNAGSNLVEV